MYVLGAQAPSFEIQKCIIFLADFVLKYFVRKNWRDEGELSN